MPLKRRSGAQRLIPQLFVVLCVFKKIIQGMAVDESVQIAMKIVAKCVNKCELQYTASTSSLNARCTYRACLVGMFV
jgi:hypothetical protein